MDGVDGGCSRSLSGLGSAPRQACGGLQPGPVIFELHGHQSGALDPNSQLSTSFKRNSNSASLSALHRRKIFLHTRPPSPLPSPTPPPSSLPHKFLSSSPRRGPGVKWLPDVVPICSHRRGNAEAALGLSESRAPGSLMGGTVLLTARFWRSRLRVLLCSAVVSPERFPNFLFHPPATRNEKFQRVPL